MIVDRADIPRTGVSCCTRIVRLRSPAAFAYDCFYKPSCPITSPRPRDMDMHDARAPRCAREQTLGAPGMTARLAPHVPISVSAHYTDPLCMPSNGRRFAGSTPPRP